MLTLNPGSVCDVCAEEYGTNRLPHCIPCGHLLCLNCCNNIINKTSSRLSPVCPFCREPFTSDGVRLIRIDFSTSTWNTPRRRAYNIETELVDEMAMSKERFPIMEQHGSSRTRAEARRLEDKVAKVAAKKCSVEEVSTLHKELQEWLTSDMEDQTSLSLSAALLRAILMNHLAHSEASKSAKANEASLKGKIDDLDVTNSKLDAELRRQRSAFTQKTQENQALRAEMNRLKMKVAAGTLGLGARPTVDDTSPPRSLASTPVPRPPSTSPRAMSPTSPPPSFSSTNHSPFSRLAHHMRATSASSARSQTPGPLPPSTRSQTPSLHSPLRPASVGPAGHGKTRRLSNPLSSSLSSSPQRMMRSTSDDKEGTHERWIPSIHPDASSPPQRRFAYPSHT